MAFGLPTDQRSQVMLAIIVVSLAGGYFLYDKFQAPRREEITTTQQMIDSLNTVIQKAKADLATGSAASVDRDVAQYRAALGLMRRLVPEVNEVPTLLEDISNRAKLRGVTIGKFQPLGTEAGPALPITFKEPGDTTPANKKKAPEPAFDVNRYRLEVYGHYDQIGEYLADVASLPRIVVPQDVILSSATPAVQKLLADTAGALLLAEFSIRTFVKSTLPRPAAKPAAAGAPRARS